MAESIFDHHVKNSIFQEILKGKIKNVEKDFGSLYNGNTVVALMVTCIEIWKRFLVQRDILVQQNPKAFNQCKNPSDLYRKN